MDLKMLKNVLYIAGVSLLLTACTQPTFYEKVNKFENKTWKQNEVADYQIDVQDTSVSYQFVLTLRTTTDYQYNNLWVFWTTTTPDGEVSREPFQFQITDEAGNWTGKKSGSIVENQLTFNARKLPLKGIYKFRLEQAVTESNVDEVLDLGLSIEQK